MNIVFDVGLKASYCMICGGVSKVFGVSTPKAALSYGIGSSVTTMILRNIPLTSQKLVNIVATIFICHFAGKALTKRICNIEVTAKDALKLFAGTMLVTGLLTTVATASLIAVDGVSQILLRA